MLNTYPDLLWQITRKVVFNLEQSAKSDKLVRPQSFYDAALSKAESLPKKITEPTIDVSKIPDFEEKFETLRDTPLFSGLTDEALYPLVKTVNKKRVAKGETIFLKGDLPDYMYIIREGSVVIKKDNNDLSLLNGHDFFGEAGIINNQPRLASAIAGEDCVLLQISKEAFDSVAASHKSIARSILFKMVSYMHPNAHLQAGDKLFQIESLLPEFDHTGVCELFFDRLGLGKSASLTVLDLYQIVSDDKIYYITEKGVHEKDKPDPKSLPKKPWERPLSETPPKHIEVTAAWNDVEPSEDRVTFAKNGTFILDEESLNIPLIPATDEALSYYGACLLEANELFMFSAKDFPLWDVVIGDDYLEKFIMTPQGGGIYLEKHEDKPHLHMPTGKNSSGCYILGKKISPEGSSERYRLTAFSIPFGKAVYTPGSVIHCDAGLKGNWIVGYDHAEKLSAVSLQTKTGKKVKLSLC